MTPTEQGVFYEDEAGVGGVGGRPSGFTLRDALYVVFRHKWKMAVFFWVVLLGGAGFLLALPEHFRSEAVVLIKGGRNPLTKDPEISVPMVESPVLDELALMRGRVLAERVVAGVGAERILTQRPRRHRLAESLLSRLGVSLSSGKPEATAAWAAAGGAGEMERLAVKYVMGNLELRRQRSGSNMIEAAFTALEPDLAQRVLADLLRFYQERHVEVYEAEVSPEFFARETSRTLAALTSKQLELEVFCRKHKIVSLDSQKEQLLEMLRALRVNLSGSRARISALSAKIGAYEKELEAIEGVAAAAPAGGGREESASSPSLPPPRRVRAAPTPVSPLVLELKRSLMALRVKQGEVSRRYPESSREYQDAADEIRIAEAALAAELGLSAEGGDGDEGDLAASSVAAAPPPLPPVDDAARRQLEILLVTTRADLTSEKAGMATLEKDLPGLDKDLSALQGLESSLRRLEGEESVLQSTYEQLSTDLKRSYFARALDRDMVTNVAVIQEATFPYEPVKSDRRRNAALVLFAAFFGSLGLAALAEYMDHTFKTKEDVEKHLGLPVLATVSRKDFKSCT